MYSSLYQTGSYIKYLNMSSPMKSIKAIDPMTYQGQPGDLGCQSNCDAGFFNGLQPIMSNQASSLVPRVHEAAGTCGEVGGW